MLEWVALCFSILHIFLDKESEARTGGLTWCRELAGLGANSALSDYKAREVYLLFTLCLYIHHCT